MEDLIKAKDEQIAKLNDLKELLKEQILSLQEENTQLKNDFFELEEKFKQLPIENTQKPDYQNMFNSINAKLSTINEKLDKISAEGIVASVSSQSKLASKSRAVNERDLKKSESHPAERGLLKPSSLFADELEKDSVANQPQVKPTPTQSENKEASSFHAADPRSLHRTVLEIDYPENGAIQCPKCNGQQFQEMPEPSRGSFAKKYYCKKCRQEWRYIY